MLAGTYSTSYKTGGKQHGTHLQDLQEERADMLARNRRMQLETSKRRRALASKRKMEVQKEEKRRQTILSKRREQIREATEKYQRLNKNYTKFQQGEAGLQTRVPGLDEALRAVRGSPRYFRRSLSHDGIIQKPTSCSPRQDVQPSHTTRYADNTYTKPGSVKRHTHRTSSAYMTRPHQTLHNDQGTSHQRSNNDFRRAHGQRPSYATTNQRQNDTQHYYNDQGHLQTHSKHQGPYQHQGRNDPAHQDGVNNENHYNQNSTYQVGVNNGPHHNYNQDSVHQVGVNHGAYTDFSQDSTHAVNHRTRHNYNNYTAGNYQNQTNAQMDLQSRSLRNRTNSRTLFEQQLQQYQHRLAEEQKRSLLQFNQAIQQEMERDKKLLGEEDIVQEIPQTVSPCSADSLDDTRVSVLASQSDSTLYEKSDENEASDRPLRVKSAPVSQTNVTGRNGIQGVLSSGICTHPTSTPAGHGSSVTAQAGHGSSVTAQAGHGSSVTAQAGHGSSVTAQAGHGSSETAQSHANGNTSSMYTTSICTNTSSPVKAVAARAASSQPNVVGLSSVPVQGVSIHPASSQTNFVNVSSSPVKSVVARPAANQVNTLGVSSTSSVLRTSSRVAVVQPSVMQKSTNMTSFSQKQGLFNSGPGPKEWRDNAEINNCPEQTTDDKRVNMLHPVPGSTKTYATVSGNNDHFRQDASVNFVHTFDSSNNHLENSNVLTGQFSSSDARSDDAFKGRTKAWTTPTPDQPETVSADLCRRTADSKAKENTTVTYSKPYLYGTTATNVTVTSQYDDTSAVTSQHTNAIPVPPSLASFYQNPQLLTEAVTTPLPGPEVAMATASSHRNTTQSQIQRQRPTVAQPGAGYTSQPQSRKQTEDILEESESDVEEESKPIPQKKVIKGILKKSPVGCEGMQKQLGVRGRRHVLVRSLSATASVRDSVEVTKQHLQHREIEAQTKPRRKSVRFADLVYDDDSDSQSGEDPIEEQMFDPAPHNTTSEQQEQRTSRPVSAKPPISIPSSRVTTHISRANSAATEKRGPFIRPHPPAHPPTGRAMASRMAAAHKANPTTPTKPAEESKHPHSTHAHPPSAPTSVASHPPSSTQKQNSSAVNNTSENVYSSDGVPLDRTPTDDEINWLWQKVRTCLSRDSTHQTGTASPSITSNVATSRTTAQVSQKYIDGNSLASKIRVSNRPTTTTTATAVQIPVKKVTMDAMTSYTKKQNSLLQQRRQYGATNGGLAGGMTGGMTTTATTQSTIQTLPCQQPTQSSTVPASTLPVNTHPHISESMAAFLTAEMLSRQSAGESDIEEAMEQAEYKQRTINASRPTQHVPTAISVEEQRLLASLDRLNERLKVAETKQINNTPAFAPKPPYQYGTFRGHKPLSGATRRFVNNNGTVSRYNFRNVATAHDQTGLHRHR